MGLLDILGQPTDSIWGMINRLPSLFSQQEPPKRIDQPRHDKSAMYPPPKQQMQAPQYTDQRSDNKILVEQAIDKHFPNDPSGKAAIMSQIQHENDTFNPHTIEETAKPEKGIGLFQFTGKQRISLEKWLRDNGKENTIDNQIEYFKLLTTTDDQAWAKKYHDIGYSNREDIRNSFASGNASETSKELSQKFEKFVGWKTNTSRPNLAMKLEPTYQQEYVNKLAKESNTYQQQMQAQMQAPTQMLNKSYENAPQMYPPPKQQMQQQAQMQQQQQQMQQQQQQMQMPKRRSLEEVTQTAQVQPALSPFPWLREVSGSYSYPSPPVGRWV